MRLRRFHGRRPRGRGVPWTRTDGQAALIRKPASAGVRIGRSDLAQPKSEPRPSKPPSSSSSSSSASSAAGASAPPAAAGRQAAAGRAAAWVMASAMSTPEGGHESLHSSVVCVDASALQDSLHRLLIDLFFSSVQQHSSVYVFHVFSPQCVFVCSAEQARGRQSRPLLPLLPLLRPRLGLRKRSCRRRRGGAVAEAAAPIMAAKSSSSASGLSMPATPRALAWARATRWAASRRLRSRFHSDGQRFSAGLGQDGRHGLWREPRNVAGQVECTRAMPIKSCSNCS